MKKLMLFTELWLKNALLRGLEESNYTNATPIQEQTILAFNEGKDVVGQSQTWTGKTAAFALSLLNVVDPTLHKVQAIILAPTRELAGQTQEEFFNLGRHARVRTLAAYGWKSIRFQKKLLDQGMHVAVCTPGRAIDLLKRKFIDPDAIKYFVLDEVDRMLDMGFVDDVEWLWSQCKNIQQTMLFSATITKEVQWIINRHLKKDYKFIEIEPEKIVVDRIDHSFVVLKHFQKQEILLDWLSKNKDEKAIIFTQTKRVAAQLAWFLNDEGFPTGHLSGDMEQRDRTASLQNYKTDSVKILVATDVASRGLNMKDITMVINYDVPQDPESYVHRIGRTARAGKSGKAIMFVTENELRSVYLIERRNKITIPQRDLAWEPVERKNQQSTGSTYQGRRKFVAPHGGARREFSKFPPRRPQSFSRDERPWEARAPQHHSRDHRPSDARGPRASTSSFRSPRSDNFKTPRSDNFKSENFRRPRKPTTKELMADFVPKTEKPKRGSYWGKE